SRRDDLEVWIARGDPMRAGAPLGLVAQVVRQAAHLCGDEPLATRRRQLVSRGARPRRPAGPGRGGEVLGGVRGPAFPRPSRGAARQSALLMSDQMSRAWVDFLGAECRARPVMLVLEDVHWGDRPTVEYVDTALRLLEDRPLFVLALARPEVHDVFPGLWSE